MFKEFVAFLKQYGVIGLTLAVIIGGKLNTFMTSLVNDFVTPLILSPALKYTGVEKINELNFHGIMYGKVLAAFIDFFIVAFLVFIFAKKVMKEEVVSKK